MRSPTRIDFEIGRETKVGRRDRNVEKTATAKERERDRESRRNFQVRETGYTVRKNQRLCTHLRSKSRRDAYGRRRRKLDTVRAGTRRDGPVRFNFPRAAPTSDAAIESTGDATGVKAISSTKFHGIAPPNAPRRSRVSSTRQSRLPFGNRGNVPPRFGNVSILCFFHESRSTRSGREP